MAALALQQVTQPVPKVTCAAPDPHSSRQCVLGHLRPPHHHVPAWIPRRPDVCPCQKDFSALRAQTGTAGSECGCSSRSAMRKNKGKTRTSWKPMTSPIRKQASTSTRFTSPRPSKTQGKARLSVTLKVLKPKVPSLFSPLHLLLFPFNFPRSV